MVSLLSNNNPFEDEGEQNKLGIKLRQSKWCNGGTILIIGDI